MSKDVGPEFELWAAAVAWTIALGAFLLFVPFYRKADRKPAGAFLAFAAAYALEMLGAPLSLYFAVWAFGRFLPQGVFSGQALSQSMARIGHWVFVASILAGGSLIVAAWSLIFRDFWSKEDGEGRLVREGLYRYVRHPQYAGFLIVSLGALFDAATIPLVLLWPVLALLYYRLARVEERDLQRRFGREWRDYEAKTGMFLPRLPGRRRP